MLRQYALQRRPQVGMTQFRRRSVVAAVVIPLHQFAIAEQQFSGIQHISAVSDGGMTLNAERCIIGAVRSLGGADENAIRITGKNRVQESAIDRRLNVGRGIFLQKGVGVAFILLQFQDLPGRGRFVPVRSDGGESVWRGALMARQWTVSRDPRAQAAVLLTWIRSGQRTALVPRGKHFLSSGPRVGTGP